MTAEVGKVLATRELQLDGRRVFVAIGKPRAFPEPMDLGYFCCLRIEGSEPNPIRLYAAGSRPHQALMTGLGMVSDQLGIALTDLLTDTYIDGREN